MVINIAHKEPRAVKSQHLATSGMPRLKISDRPLGILTTTLINGTPLNPSVQHCCGNRGDFCGKGGIYAPMMPRGDGISLHNFPNAAECPNVVHLATTKPS